MLDADYTGNVSVGGAADVRIVDTLVIRKAAVGSMDNNVYLLTCRCTGAQVLIDAAADLPRLQQLIREGSPTSRLDMIVTTHTHHDHVGALKSLVAVTGARTAVGAADAAELPVRPDLMLKHGDVIHVGIHDLKVIGLRGHTPGSIALAFVAKYYGTHIFTGDSLFPGGVGATKGDPARFQQLITDVEERIFAPYDDETWIYPGHGDDTTLGKERPHLAEWHERGW